MSGKNTRELIFQYLQEKGQASGQELARWVQVSRNAVWKHIHKLQKEGYPVQSISGRGYVLHPDPDLLLPLKIRSGLETSILGKEIICRRELDSTQTLARSLAQKGASQGLLVLAERQRTGRGRLDRSWSSPAGNIYLSCLLRPGIELFRTPQIPLLAGVAVARALNRHLGLNCRLKWPNDLLYLGQKLGGILAEVSAEADRIQYLILGLGLNVNARIQDLDPQVREIATSLSLSLDQHIPRLPLLQQILLSLEEEYNEFLSQGFGKIRQQWLQMNCTLGREVAFCRDRSKISGLALDLDDTGGLQVKLASGQVTTLQAGDISFI
ncbi:MAG: biotin--[acetyl-CoA-carboxylase] ligase [Desulfohalobiaceae bacterium]